MVASLCSVGFLWVNEESRTEKLFIPQDNRAIKNLDTAERFCRYKVRDEGVILVARPEHPNILTPECWAETQEVHNQVMSLKSFLEFCLTVFRDGKLVL